jgi:dienelactone hydrolase
VFVDYTPAPDAQYPVQLEEAYAATKWIAENGESLNLDPSKLALLGDSVGGNMAIAVAMIAKERGGPRIDFQVLFYPVTDANFETGSYKEFAMGHWLARDAMRWFWDNYLPDKQKRAELHASPLRASNEQLKGMPPTLLIVGENDVLRDEGEAYAHKLAQAGVPVTATRYLGTIHDFVLLNPITHTPAPREALRQAISTLRKVFGWGARREKAREGGGGPSAHAPLTSPDPRPCPIAIGCTSAGPASDSPAGAHLILPLVTVRDTFRGITRRRAGGGAPWRTRAWFVVGWTGRTRSRPGPSRSSLA